MNTTDISQLLNSHPVTKDHFQEVLAYDQIPEKGKEGYYIINLDTSKEKGSHWIAIKISHPPEKNLFFDSYGLSPQKEKFKKFLKKNYLHNSVHLQHPLSTTCGQWCIFFIYHSCKKLNFKEMFKYFNPKDLLLNDYEMNTFISRIFKTKQKIIDFNFLKSQIQNSQKMMRNLRCCSYYKMCKKNKKIKCLQKIARQDYPVHL